MENKPVGFALNALRKGARVLSVEADKLWADAREEHRWAIGRKPQPKAVEVCAAAKEMYDTSRDMRIAYDKAADAEIAYNNARAECDKAKKEFDDFPESERKEYLERD